MEILRPLGVAQVYKSIIVSLHNQRRFSFVHDLIRPSFARRSKPRETRHRDGLRNGGKRLLTRLGYARATLPLRAGIPVCSKHTRASCATPSLISSFDGSA